MSKSRVLIAFNGDARGYPPLTRLIDHYVLLGSSVLLIARSSAVFKKVTLDVSSQVTTDITSISQNRYIRQIQNAFFFLRVLKAAVSRSTRHIVVVEPPMRFLGLLLSQLSRVPVTYLEYDESMPALSLRTKVSQWLMQRFARSAFAIVVPNNSRKRNFVERYQPHCPVEILSNHPVRSEFVDPDKIVPYSQGEPLVLYYHGSFVKERMPISIVHSMKLLQGFDLLMKPVIPDIVGGGQWLENFLKEARDLGVSERIRSMDILTINELRNLGSTCHVGIAFYECKDASDTNLKSMWGASNKAVQYAAYGLAILCSTVEEEMLSQLKIGAKICNMHDPASIASAIKEFMQDPTQLNRMRSAIHRKASDEWTFEAVVKDPGVSRALGISET